MKKILSAIGILGFALAAHGQPSTLPLSTPETLKTLKTSPVASPNRTHPAELTTATRQNKQHHHFYNRHSKDGPDALVWVDATGKSVGRFLNAFTVVVTFNHQPAAVSGLQLAECESACTGLTGARWPDSGATLLLYASSDCTGQAYSSASSPMPYVARPVEEDGTTYIYFFKISGSVRVTTNSFFIGNQCEVDPRGNSQVVAPLVAVIPASDIGVEPFTVK